MLKLAAHVIFKEMNLTSYSDRYGEHQIDCITFAWASLARQRKDDDAPTWASHFVPEMVIEIDASGRKVIKRPPGLAVGSRTESKVDPVPVLERPVVNISSGRKIDTMSIDEILDAASKVDE